MRCRTQQEQAHFFYCNPIACPRDAPYSPLTEPLRGPLPPPLDHSYPSPSFLPTILLLEHSSPPLTPSGYRRLTMWRSPSTLRLLRRELSVEPGRRQWTDQHLHPPPIRHWAQLCSSASSPSGSGGGGGRDGGGAAADSMSIAEAKRLMRLVNVEAMKRRLGMQGEEIIGYSKLLEVCEGMGVARNKEEAATFATVLDEAGIVLLFRDQVYLHPNKVVDQVRKAVPLASTPDDDPHHAELKQLQEKKGEIDMLAHKQVRRILWSGLGFFVVQVGLFFRLTFWEFSWDVMEPIAFFGSAAGLLVGYAYFLFTSRDPTYQNLTKRLFLSRQRKLLQKKNFDMEKFMELQRHCKSPLDHHHAGVMGTQVP